VANGKHRRTRIFRLDQEEGIIEGDQNLKKFITNYYKGLFGEPTVNNFSLVESDTSDIPQISHLENEVLTAEFSKQEVNTIRNINFYDENANDESQTVIEDHFL